MDDDKKRRRDHDKVEHSEISDSGYFTIISKDEEKEPYISGEDSSGPKAFTKPSTAGGRPRGRNHDTPQYRALKKAQMQVSRARSAEAKAHPASTHESSDTVFRNQLFSSAPRYVCIRTSEADSNTTQIHLRRYHSSSPQPSSSFSTNAHTTTYRDGDATSHATSFATTVADRGAVVPLVC